MADRVPVPSPTPKDWKRFMAQVRVQPSGCWEWAGGKWPTGYASFHLGGRPRRAHRVLYVWLYGEVEEGTDLDHVCRNRACVNPDHLEACTRKENVLRGSGPSAVNARKTHCKHGHEFTPENVFYDWKGWRQCRTCRRKRHEAKMALHRDEINARRRERRKRVEHEPRACERCGKVFVPQRVTKRFCSYVCQQRSAYAKRNELKGRSASLSALRQGAANPNARLSDEQVAEIRARYTGVRGQQSALAREYGVSQPHIRRIVNGEQRSGPPAP